MSRMTIAVMMLVLGLSLTVPEVGRAEEPTGQPATDPTFRRLTLLNAVNADGPRRGQARREARTDREKVFTSVYDVGELVVPVGQTGCNANYKPLMELITSVIRPATWEGSGGRGTIAASPGNLCIVVSQTKEVQEEICDLLEQLRRQQEYQVVLDLKIIRARDQAISSGTQANGVGRNSGIWQPQADELLDAVGQHRNVDSVAVSRITMLNGQTGILGPFHDGDMHTVRLSTQVVVSGDRRYIRLFMGAVDQSEKSSLPGRLLASAWIADGQSLVVSLPSDQSDRQKDDSRRSDVKSANVQRLLLVTARIVVKEEEEDRIPAPKASSVEKVNKPRS